MTASLYKLFRDKALSHQSPLSQEQLKFLSDNIKNLDQDGADNLYLLVRYSANIEDDATVYNAKFTRRSVIFNLEAMPSLLQKIIFFFVTKHLQETSAEADITFG